MVVKELEADTVSSSAGVGHHGGRFSPGAFSQAAFVTIKVRYQWLGHVTGHVTVAGGGGEVCSGRAVGEGGFVQCPVHEGSADGDSEQNDQ